MLTARLPCALSVVFLLALSSAGLAQPAMLTCVVYDTEGWVAPNIPVLLLDFDTGRVLFRAVSSSLGLVRFEMIPPDQYELRVDSVEIKTADGRRRLGPAAYDELISVLPGLKTGVDIRLAPITTLRGIVFDPNGRTLEGATVSVEDSVAHQILASGRTDGFGIASLSVPVGTHLLRVTHPPFRPAIQSVEIPPGTTQGFLVSMQYVAEEYLTIEGQPTTTAGVPGGGVGTTFGAGVVGRALVGGRGRTWQSLLLLMPGITTTESTGTLAQITAAGQRRFANRLTVDGISADLGVDMTTPALDESGSGALPALATSGGTQTLVPFGAVEEIQIRTTNASPEYAQSLGAQTAIVTRAGTDRLSGSIFTEARPRALAASDYFRTTSGAPRRFASQTAGGSLGGPLWPGRVTYFAAAEMQRVDRPYHATVPVPSDTLRASVPPPSRAILDAFPRSNGAELPGGLADYTAAFPLTSSLGTLSVRTDVTAGAHRLFARVNLGTSRGDAVRSPGQQPDYTFRHTESTTTRTATIGLQSSLSARTLHDLRANVSEHRGSLVASSAGAGDLDLAALVPGASNPWVRIVPVPGPAGAVQAGRTGASSQTQVQLVDTLTLVRGRHEWRVGLDASQAIGSVPGSTRYTYTLTPVVQLQQGRARVTIEDRQPARARFLSGAMFAQDTFRVSPRLSLTYGLRYSVTPAPSSDTDLDPALVRSDLLPAIEPRGGRAWRTSWSSVGPHVAGTYQLVTTAGHETALRAGWDRVYDDLSSPGGSAFGSGAPYVWRALLLPSTLPIAPEVFAAAVPIDGIERYAFADTLRRPRTDRWYFALDRAFGAAQRVSVTYAGNVARDLVYRSAYMQSSGAPVYLFTPDGAAEYHGLLVDYTRRRTRGLQGSVAYTWSHAIDNDSGESPAPNLPPAVFDPRGNRGDADYDRRHLLTATGSYLLPAWRRSRITSALTDGWQVDLVGTVRSGAPVTVTLLRESVSIRPDVVSGVTAQIADASTFAIPPADRVQGTLGRNTFTSSSLRQIDVALSRMINLGGSRASLQLRLDVFNALNRSNFGPVYGVLGTPAFGGPRESAADALGTGSLLQGGLVALQQLGGPRSIQIAGRLKW